MRKMIRYLIPALLICMSGTASAVPIDYTINLAPGSGPGGSGSFTWDDSTSNVTNFVLTLGAFGPFPGGTNDGAPASYGPVFDGTNFTTQISVVYTPFFDVRINPDGSYAGTNGRVSGSYATAGSPTAVPEPGSLALLAAGLLALGSMRRLRGRH